MASPFRMVFLSSLLFLLLLAGIFVYRLLFLKRSYHFFLLVLLFSLLPIVSIWRAGIYESGDFAINITKEISFYQNLSQGIWHPLWSENANATYGYPLFLFTYPLPYYVISLCHFIGFSFINALKLLMSLSFIASGIGMYLWMKEKFDKRTGCIAALFYLFAPYHLVDLHFRVDIGELSAISLMPFVLYSLTTYIRKKSPLSFLAAILTSAALLLSHQAIALIFFPFVFLYSILISSKRSIRCILVAIFPVAIGILLAAFYWLPVISETIYTQQPLYAKTLDFVQFPQLLFSPWRNGFLFQGHTGELSFIIGYTQLLLFFIAIYLLWTNRFSKKEKPLLLFCLLFFLALCFLMLPQSKPLWYIIPFIKNFQFTYRLLAIILLLSSVIAALTLRRLKNRYLTIALCLVTIAYTILNWGNRGMITNVTDQMLQKQLPFATAKGEGMGPAAPKWTNSSSPWRDTIPPSHLQILQGKAAITEKERRTNHHEYSIVAMTPLTLKENTSYFPGWHITANGKPIAINYTSKAYPDIMLFQLPKGTYQLSVTFEELPIQKIADAISIITLLCVVTLLSLGPKRKIL